VGWAAACRSLELMWTLRHSATKLPFRSHRWCTQLGATSRLASSLRQKRKTGLVMAVATGGAALSYFLEPGPCEAALPREYHADALTQYWRARPWAVSGRCLQVLSELLPLAFSFLVDSSTGKLQLDDEACRRHAVLLREALVRLGPAFIKAGQALSIRPDLMPAVALKELQRMCDDCPAFPWPLAKEVIEAELGRSVGDVFIGLEADEPEQDPIAAASLGQVYCWRLRSDGSKAAVKVQRPGMAHAVALDIYILRKLAWVVRETIRRITNARVDHVALLDAWASGTVKELDYENEARNQDRFREQLGRLFGKHVYVPAVQHEFSRQHVLVSEWVEGPRLSDCSPEVIRSLCPVGVECFLAQLLELGLFHSDPHPGNLLVSQGRLVLLDFGLVAEIEDLNLHRHATAIVNLINARYEDLLDDFIALGFLPEDVDKERVLPPIVSVLEQGMQAGADLKRRKQNFQAISDDLNDVFFELPFMVPEYFALVTRALATLEGIALLGDPEFDIFWAAYPYALSRTAALLGPRGTSSLLSAAAAHTVQQKTAQERARVTQPMATKKVDTGRAAESPMQPTAILCE